MTGTGAQLPPDLYAEVQHFYARQMRSLDDRDFEEFAETFTKDGEFSHSPGQSVRSRPDIVAELRAFHRKFDDDPVVRRHWFAMTTLEEEAAEDGALRAVSYAYVVDTRPGGDQRMGPHCVVHDVLVRVDGELRNRSRRVLQDRFLR